MAKSKTKPPVKAVRKSPARNSSDKLRTLVNLNIDGTPLYTQKELSAMLGISVRTIRRFKNQKGYALAPATSARIKNNVNREDQKIRRFINAGTAFESVVETKKGKTVRRLKQIKDKSLKLPQGKILQFPVVYRARGGESVTQKIDVSGWTTQDKIDFLESAGASKRFQSWHARVMVPPGVGRSGRKGEGEIVEDEEEIGEDDEGNEFVIKPSPEYYMIGPFDLTRNRAKIRTELHYHEDAGRVIVEIFLVEKIK